VKRVSPRSATAVSLISTFVLYVSFWLAGELGSPALSTPLNESLLKVVLWVLPSLLIVAISCRLSLVEALRELGLLANPLAGVALGVATAIPLLALSVHTTLPDLSVRAIAGPSLIGPFAEEVLFRGLLFRQLVRRGRQRVLWSIAVSAIVFGCAHFTVLVDYSRGHWIWVHSWTFWSAELGLAAVGGLLFAWIVQRWDSLWPAIGVHSCLNLSWQMTIGVADLTTFSTTMTRLASVAIAIYVTWRVTRTRAGRTRVIARVPDVDQVRS
jgi:membrane protease YdiL (CAAX protease family)